MAELRREEQAKKLFWLLKPATLRSGVSYQPAKLTEFPVVVQKFVQERLIERLSSGEKEKLRQDDGKWPELACTIQLLADRYPVLPPGPWGEIKDKNKLGLRLGADSTRSTSGGWDKRRSSGYTPGYNKPWPVYALAVAEKMRRSGKKIPPLGASRPDEFPTAVKSYLRETFLPSLSAGVGQLAHARGALAGLSEALLELARLKRQVIPGMSLPGPRDLWEAAYAEASDVPAHLLYDFAMNELTPQDRAGLKLTPADLHGSVAKLKAMYLKSRKHYHK